MSVYDKDTFTIPVSFDEFVTWLEGHARRTKINSGYIHGAYAPGHAAAVSVVAHGAQIAFILLEDADDRATLRAEIWCSIEPTPESRQWYAETLQAIRLKWPQHTKKKPGRRKMDCNAWAEEQARQGRTVADIFDEWRRRYTEETSEAEYQGVDDPRRYLTEVMSRTRRVKK